MLTRANAQQLVEESEVLQREPGADDQHLDVVIHTIGAYRGRVLDRPARLEDGFFAAAALCLPFLCKDEEYRVLMRARRARWFTGVPEGIAHSRAQYYFTPEFLGLDLDQLAALISRPGAADEIQPYLGGMPRELPPEEGMPG